jgi:hypothetical protein
VVKRKIPSICYHFSQSVVSFQVNSEHEGSVIVAVLFGHTEKFQFSWETFLVADGASSEFQGG